MTGGPTLPHARWTHARWTHASSDARIQAERWRTALAVVITSTMVVLCAPQATNAQAEPILGEFTVSQSTTVCYQQPEVTSTADGRFVAVWRDTMNFFGQRYASTGMPLGSVMTLHSGTGLGAMALAGSDDGGFVIVWDERPSESTGEVKAKRFDSSGSALGAIIAVSNTTEQPILVPSPQNPPAKKKSSNQLKQIVHLVAISHIL